MNDTDKKIKSLEKRLSEQSGQNVQVHPWATDSIFPFADVMDINVGYHTMGAMESFQVLTRIPTAEEGWMALEKRILAMIKANG